MNVFSKSNQAISKYDSPIEVISLTAMNHARGLGRFTSLAYSPLPHFIRTGSEEASEIQLLPHGRDDLRQRRFRTKLLALFLRFGLVFAAGEAFLEGHGDRDYGVTGCVLFDPLGNFGKVLVLLADVVFLAEVDEVDHRLGGQQEKRVDDLDLRIRCISLRRVIKD